ncbi:hypothetical protein V8D89_000433 [Ganoderma adspersum]
MPAALLLLYAEAGPAVPSDEFNDWYDNDHVPLSVPIPSFHSCPTSVDDIPYASFTDRDRSILGRLALVERRTYILHEPVHPPKAGASYSAGAPGPFISSVTMDIPDEHVADFDRWYDEEHIPLMAKIPGWVRTRRFVFADTTVLGTEAESLSPVGGPHKFLTLHEWESPTALATEEYKAAISSDGSASIFLPPTSPCSSSCTPKYVYVSPRPEPGGGLPALFPPTLSPETIERCRP